ncbi:hypothetical protein LX83_002592 [Goodfellowiella coeruleoviolacea]|uniref:Uncharacterized protein n=1 Tax=Goodfellowiella coeruleoviolacea TaxID=334858 RepID=A0AAE3GEB7_9PSEU|nr:hypothetical protein [Goodfellowiella coeruleoviolacea]
MSRLPLAQLALPQPMPLPELPPSTSGMPTLEMSTLEMSTLGMPTLGMPTRWMSIP